MPDIVREGEKHQTVPSDLTLRVKSLESLLVEKGLVDLSRQQRASQGEKRQHVYSVRFAATELWGAIASARDSVHLDLWDDYLEPD